MYDDTKKQMFQQALFARTHISSIKVVKHHSIKVNVLVTPTYILSFIQNSENGKHIIIE